eukprot:3104111-Pleurochrysis_carterae.AAC.1
MLAGGRGFFGVWWRSRSGGVGSGLRYGDGADKFGRRRRSGGNGFRIGGLGVETRRVERPKDLGDEEIEIRRIGCVGAR